MARAVDFEPTPSGIMVPTKSCGLLLTQVLEHVKVYSNGDVEKNLKAQENSRREDLKKFYQTMLERGETRVLSKVPDKDAFEILYSESPNHGKVIKDLSQMATLARNSGESMQFSPILLLGPPGIGKTHFAMKLAEILKIQYELLSMGSLTGGMVISGNSSQWSDAKVGVVAKALVEGKNANPLIMLDEIDKAAKDSRYDPLGSFYTLLESETAKKFKDEFVDIQMDASRVLWVATANDVSTIPEAILSRMEVYEISHPTVEEVRLIAQNIYVGLLKDHPKWSFSPLPSELVIEKLLKIAPREMKKVLLRAFAAASEKNRDHLLPEDLDLSRLEPSKPRIGF